WAHPFVGGDRGPGGSDRGVAAGAGLRRRSRGRVGYVARNIARYVVRSPVAPVRCVRGQRVHVIRRGTGADLMGAPGTAHSDDEARQTRLIQAQRRVGAAGARALQSDVSGMSITSKPRARGLIRFTTRCTASARAATA